MPDLNILPKEEFDKFEGKQIGNKKYISAKTPDKNYESSGKVGKQSTLSKNEYMQKYIKRHPDMSAQEINNHYGSNVIGENSFNTFNDLAGLNKVVTYEQTGIVNRENETNITNDGGSSTGDIPDGGGGSFTYTFSDDDSNKEKKRSFKNIFKRKDKIKGDGLTECSSDDPTSCGLNMAKEIGKEKKAETKAYNQAQKDRSYRVKKDGTQVLKKQFAPGEWFSEKMESHRINKAKSQGQSSRRKEQREISKQRNKRSRANSREHQHNNPQNYNKVSNFFNELSYKKDTKAKSRTIKASF